LLPRLARCHAWLRLARCHAWLPRLAATAPGTPCAPDWQVCLLPRLLGARLPLADLLQGTGALRPASQTCHHSTTSLHTPKHGS